MTSDYESLLKGTHWKTQADEQDAATLAASKEAVSDAASKVFITIDRIGRRIHSGFGSDEAVEANEAVTTFLTQLNDMLVGNGGQITANFSNPTVASVDQTQVHELESRAERAEQELRTVQGNQDDLNRSAQRASNLQIEAAELRRENSRLQQEVATLTEENAELHHELEAEVANHQEAVNALRRAVSEKDEAAESEHAWQSRSEAVEQQLNGANTRITELQEREERALDAATHWRGIAVSLGYVEPDGSDQPDAPEDSTTGTQPARQPYPGGGGIGDEDVTDPLIGGPNGAFSGDQSTAPAADEPQPRRRRSWRRPERHSRRERLTNPDQSSNPEGA